ncbi:TPM domain-containing protein [Nitratifractor salsuginis]|uniref:PDZ domain-containing protein n=1 Tax=Nitratifractor salsuginis (strain DSM 16511 / JCM 12458 / E9I37-1) TaxID=749222 RepID=E6X0Y9_NITSE|nr:TPM domain-containing protein [Nitratifractor salsuginis]ADV46921.1 hypothetical protein Nitsa_1673 [Nitratifractor salsuginis DSM 16511]
MKTLVKTLIFLTISTLFIGCQNQAENSRSVASQAPAAQIIYDDAAVLLDNDRFVREFTRYNRWLKKRYDIDFRVVTTIDDGDIDLYANRRFNTLMKESRSHSGKALLLVINPVQDKVRLEVSEALEPIFTDAFVSYIERKGFIPYFRDQSIAEGVFMAMELIKDRLNDAAAGKEFLPPMKTKSIGGGAKNKAHIGQKDPHAKEGAQVTVKAAEPPKAVLKRYLNEVLKKHNKNPDLDIYTEASRKFFHHWTVTEVNQNNEVRFLSPCIDRMETLYNPDRTHAVLAVLPYDKNRKCSPYFFRKEEGKWRLDIATMAQVLHFNTQMQWHFDTAKRLQGEGIYYAYAFDGYGIGRNGYLYTPDKPKPKDTRWGFWVRGYYHPGDRREDVRAWIRYVWPGSPAQVRLGLERGDKIYAVGEGPTRIENATHRQFMDYMKNIPSGEIATVVVEHYYLNGKETYDFDAVLKPDVQFKYETKRGIAP